MSTESPRSQNEYIREVFDYHGRDVMPADYDRIAGASRNGREHILREIPDADEDLVNDLHDAHLENSRYDQFNRSVEQEDDRNFLQRHPVLTTVGVTAAGLAAAYFGAPYVFEWFGNSEAAQVGAGTDWFRRLGNYFAPLGGGLAPGGSGTGLGGTYGLPPGTL